MKSKWVAVWLALGMSLFSACHMKEKVLIVAATPVPHAEILEAAKPILEKEGVKLKIVEVDDYNLPNRLLFEKQVDANFFQHIPFLEEQNKRFHYKLIPLTAVHIEPLGIYSDSVTSLNDLKEGACIAVPSDPTNEARALDLLTDSGLIKLKERAKGGVATIYDISENPKKIKIIEVDAPFLPRALQDMDAAVIPANYALQANLKPSHDALALEPIDSPFANIVAVRNGDQNLEEIQKLKNVLASEEIRQFILQKYKGAITPTS